jgi:hypothetical protein
LVLKYLTRQLSELENLTRGVSVLAILLEVLGPG